MYFFKGSVNYEELKNTPIPEIYELITEINVLQKQIEKDIK
jgi:hypothetical protein